MRIAAAQLSTGPDPDANLDQVIAALSAAAERGARVVVCPEATMRAFGAGSLDAIAEDLDGPWAHAVADAARRLDVVAIVGMFRPAPAGRVHNTLLVTGVSHAAAGNRELHLGYNKIHLFDAFGFAESRTVAPGDDVRVVDIDGVGIGLSICYDIRFPEHYRALAQRGADLTVCSASWGAGPGKVDQWRLLARARALDATTFLVACGQAAPQAPTWSESAGASVGAPTGVGHSLAVGPDGAVLAELGEQPELFVVDIDPAAAHAVRRALPVLRNGRVTERPWRPPAEPPDNESADARAERTEEGR